MAIELVALLTVLADLASRRIRPESMPLATSQSYITWASVWPLRFAPPETSTLEAGYLPSAASATLRRRSVFTVILPVLLREEPSTTNTWPLVGRPFGVVVWIFRPLFARSQDARNWVHN